MNKKIFTLLAGALLLLSTAHEANAKIGFGSTLSGDVVTTLPDGTGQGLYHIRIDAILDTAASGGTLFWKSVTRADSTYGFLDNKTIDFGSIDPTPPGVGDTIVLAVNNYGKLMPVSMYDFRHTKSVLSYKDLQPTMWCITTKREDLGLWPRFYFKNKALEGYLPFIKKEESYLDMDMDMSEDKDKYKGGMFSPSYENGQLRSGEPLYRRYAGDSYLVFVYDPSKGISTREISIHAFTHTNNGDPIDKTVLGMLKVSIIEVGPVVLDAAAFNSHLYNKAESDKSLTQLKFDPDNAGVNIDNHFAKPLLAEDVHPSVVIDNDNGKNNYLHLYVNGKKTQRITHNKDNKAEEENYVNNVGQKYLKIDTVKATDVNNVDKAKKSAYRFVYFPSKDSLVINALQIEHKAQGAVPDGPYDAIKTTNPPYQTGTKYHGLYNDIILDRLIVRMQDLDGTARRLLTIDKYPGNTHISLGWNCNAEKVDSWQPSEGIYTIWDDRGRVLGVRLYQGALNPQWLELEPGECPEYIPAYQWYVRKDKQDEKNAIRLDNREFANLNSLGDTSAIYNVYVPDYGKNGGKSTQIFGANTTTKFAYDPLNSSSSVNGPNLEPIQNGYVAGKYIAPVNDCGMQPRTSGFRPVAQAQVKDAYLGYRHFKVNTNIETPGYGKSEEGHEKGVDDMDYTAYAFRYYSIYGQDNYIGLNKLTGDDNILQVGPSRDKEAFQLQLGTDFRIAQGAKAYKEEEYGAGKGDHSIDLSSLKLGSYTQNAVQLKRYYYEMKIADFYHYRDSLHEQFAVLKGAATDGSDAQNALRYGVANAYASEHPFRYANVYLRETYFKDGKKDEIYYAILDRIVPEQFETLANMGAEVTRITSRTNLPNRPDSAAVHGIVTWGVEDAMGYVKAQGRTISSTRVSTFALERVPYELYRRLNHKTHDTANPEGEDFHTKETLVDGPGNHPYDAPKTLRLFTQFNDANYLYEDALSGESFNKGGINFLGLANSKQHKEDEQAPDGTYKYNYNLYIDTAFINRGTGRIKPQYLIAVDPQIVKRRIVSNGVDGCGLPKEDTEVKPYIKARYLINATDSARQPGSDATDNYNRRDDSYILAPGKDRLAFVEAIHTDDRLYIVGKLREAGIYDSMYTVIEDGKTYIDADVLASLAGDRGRHPNQQKGEAVGLFYEFGVWNNYHNDVSFSLRFIDKEAKNVETDGASYLEKTNDKEASKDNFTKRFLLESETNKRTAYGNRKIAPVQGGWVQINNGAAVLSRGAYYDAIEQAEIFNVEEGKGAPISNDNVASADLKVVAGSGEVSILNVGGKKVTIANVLGQTIANFVAGSDNATVKAPKGIIVVTVEGEKTVKAIVK